ncbi:hypothetical protein [Clostridium saccharoperbutylacetonicum]|uniref:hypothetical protein n=1 Tax=Clostridium saccharoperbutylacetonicum TaxID=36745 RepID=UPI00098408D9|nr:hypothetical protein [Clostridium saccharoperbutylacetonicum]AQR93491.1 hypothetical protein CLSAP_07970 [Clostridium saccharoperbutylacetonicum]NSB29189.1 hypothetical protein [Clostridium saccharoperbutylacetonicum]
MSDIHALETNLDLKQNLNVYANCKQLDILHLIFNIFDGGLQAELTNYKVRLKAMKADNMLLIQDTQYTINKNVVTIIPDEQLTTTSGTTKIELQFINTKTGEKKATFNLTLKVIPSVLENERTISTATYTLMDELENKLDKAASFFENINKAIDANTALAVTTNNANTSNTNLNTTISAGNTLKTALDTLNATANATKNNLDASNNNAIVTKTALDTSNTNAAAAKIALDASNSEANTTKSNLDSSNSIANITKTDLDKSNANALATKADLDKLNTTANVTKADLTAVNDKAIATTNDLTDINTAANITKTDLDAENVRAEANITAMESFGDITALSKNVTNLKAEVEKARGGESDLDGRLDKITAQLSDVAYKTGTVQTNLNADKVDGYDAGNSSGNIPVSNGVVNANLNADMVDGIHASNLSQTKRLTATQINNAYLPSGIYTNTGDGLPKSDGSLIQDWWWHIFASHHYDENGYEGQIAIPFAGDSHRPMYWRGSSGGTYNAWKRVAHVEQISITTLYNGWNFWNGWGARELNKVGNIVTIDLMICNATPNASQILQLPSGFLPVSGLIVPCSTGNINISPQMWIESNGNVHMNGNLPNANDWVHLHTTYRCID